LSVGQCVVYKSKSYFRGINIVKQFMTGSSCLNEKAKLIASECVKNYPSVYYFDTSPIPNQLNALYDISYEPLE